MQSEYPGILLETDQVRCYGVDGLEMACGGTGQDGDRFGEDRALWSNRFQPTDRVVYDRLTGAHWLRDANPADLPLTWREAHDFVAEMRRRRDHGCDGWQLPSRRLLFSLISHQQVNPALPADHPFHRPFHSYYWSGDKCHGLPGQAWYVHMGGGRVHRGMTHGSYMVWPVLPGLDGFDSGNELPAGRFDAAAGCVRDLDTGLMWMAGTILPAGRVTWRQALAMVAAWNREQRDGYTDWRLPNIRELESLTYLGARHPALPPQHPFSDIQDGYWSATTSVYEPRYAWVWYTADGSVGVGFKSLAAFHVWPVRG